MLILEEHEIGDRFGDGWRLKWWITQWTGYDWLLARQNALSQELKFAIENDELLAAFSLSKCPLTRNKK